MILECASSVALVATLAVTVFDRPTFRPIVIPFRCRKVGGITFIRVFNLQLSFCKTKKAF